MASIDKLSIRGMRSFSPLRDETIAFYSPLTMIVGANGCGKTTIVECLKFLTTGALPPGSRSGQSIVNDPTMTDTNEVKASIKLQFINKAGKKTVTVRSLNVTRKRTKMEFKQLDGVVRTVNDAGESVSLSQKCSDLDKHIPELLGVSSAILENVIFCHQEDSSWPLQEGALLKKKFDDIFDSTRYTKALDAILKTKKEYLSKSKDLKADVMEIGAHMQAADDLKKTLATCLEKQDNCTRDVEELESRIESVVAKIGRYHEQFESLNQLQGELTELQWSYDALKTTIRQQKSKIEPNPEIDGATTEGLFAMMQGFEAAMGQKKQEHQHLVRDLEKKSAEAKRLNQELIALNSSRGEALSLQKQIERQNTVLLDFVQDVCKKRNLLFDGDQSNSRSVYNSFVQLLETALEDTRAEFQQSIALGRVNVQAKEKNVLEVKASMQKSKLELDSMDKELQSLNHDRATLRYTQSQFASAKTDLVTAKCEYDSAVSAVDDHTGDKRHNEAVIAFQTQIGNCSEEIRSLTDSIARNQTVLEDVAVVAVENDKLAAQLLVSEAEFASCVQDVQEYLVGCSSMGSGSCNPLFVFAKGTGSSYINSPPKGSASASVSEGYAGATITILKEEDVGFYVDAMENQCRAKKRAIQDLNDRLKPLRNELSQIHMKSDQSDATIESLSIEIDELNKERVAKLGGLLLELNAVRHELDANDTDLPQIENIAKFSSAISSSTDSDYDMLLQAGDATVNGTTEMCLFVSSSEMFFNKFERVRQKSQACPCCAREFADELQVKAYEAQMKKMARSKMTYEGTEALKERAVAVRDKMKELVTRIRGGFGKQEQLLALRAQAKEFSRTKTRLQQEEVELDLLLAAAEDTLVSMERTVVGVGHMKSKLGSVVHQLSEIRQKQSRLYDQQLASTHVLAAMEREGCAVTYGQDGDCAKFMNSVKQFHESLEHNLKEYVKQKDSVQARKESLMADEARYTKKLFNLKAMLSEKEKIHLEKKQHYDKYNETISKISELEVKLKTLESNREKLLKSSVFHGSSNNADLRETETECEAAKDSLRKLELALNDKLSSIQSDQDYGKRLLDGISDLESRSSNSGADVGAIDRSIEVLQGDISLKEEAIDAMSPKIASLGVILSQQEQTKRHVQETIDLRQNVAEKESKYNKIQELEESIAARGEVLGGSGGTAVDIKRELQRAEQMKQKLHNEKAGLAGRTSELTDQVVNIETKLGSSAYKGVNKRYKSKMIEYETTLMAITDLDSYFSALDSALANFHSLKVQEINKIIKELWQFTYRGEDIDMIEIVSGDEAADGKVSTSTSTTGSRSYNYRVVMSKGRVPLEMRGRCSAGQRVLAAIVIRLALAETFCLNCGILALDEPTTNLDEANKAGLAYSLARIIANRSKQMNFQLICITHDEDFVRAMNQEMSALTNLSLPEYYFRVRRTEDEVYKGKYFSTIERLSWEDL